MAIWFPSVFPLYLCTVIYILVVVFTCKTVFSILYDRRETPLKTGRLTFLRSTIKFLNALKTSPNSLLQKVACGRQYYKQTEFIIQQKLTWHFFQCIIYEFTSARPSGRVTQKLTRLPDYFSANIYISTLNDCIERFSTFLFISLSNNQPTDKFSTCLT